MKFIELCAGTAAMTFYLLGQKAPVPMMGSKKMLAKQIVGLTGWKRPSVVVLIDPGEWGRTHTTLFGGGWRAVADQLEAWAPEPERELFDRLRLSAPDANDVARAAAHLYLQTRTYRGKEVYPETNGWRTHGFDPEFRLSALNSPNSKPRGWFNSRPILAGKLRKLAEASKDFPPVAIVEGSAMDFPVAQGCEVFLDPPYAGREAYKYGLTREQVIVLASRWAEHNAVTVSEGEPLAALASWVTIPLTTRKMATQLAKASHEEWLTLSPRMTP